MQYIIHNPLLVLCRLSMQMLRLVFMSRIVRLQEQREVPLRLRGEMEVGGGLLSSCLVKKGPLNECGN